jgi:hypothetical protein
VFSRTLANFKLLGNEYSEGLRLIQAVR